MVKRGEERKQRTAERHEKYKKDREERARFDKLSADSVDLLATIGVGSKPGRLGGAEVDHEDVIALVRRVQHLSEMLDIDPTDVP
jgi:hypothetical protein